jgi:hypothetical protein
MVGLVFGLRQAADVKSQATLLKNHGKPILIAEGSGGNTEPAPRLDLQHGCARRRLNG